MKFQFFHLPYEGPKHSGYDHCAQALAEGLRALGFEYYSNIPYWPAYGTGELLSHQAPTGYKADVAIYSDSFLREHLHDFDSILDPKQFNVLTDTSGFMWLRAWYTTTRGQYVQKAFNQPVFDNFDLILRNHYGTYFKYDDNVSPWAFGLTERIIQAIDSQRAGAVKVQIASNFRILHDIRKMAIEALSPLLQQQYEIVTSVTESLQGAATPQVATEEQYYWERSGRRHSLAYFKLLNESMLTFTFGGLIDYPPTGDSGLHELRRQLNRLSRKIKESLGADYSKNIYLFQFDSWRMWESMVANTCPVAMDMESWGQQMPVMPVNGVHYLGIKGLNFKATAEQILNMNPEEVEAIGKNGRKWALEHYAPVPTAQRLLKLIEAKS